MATSPVSVFKLMASKVHFLAMPAMARLRLIRQSWRQKFRRRNSLRSNRPESDELSFSTRTGHISRTDKHILSTTLVVTIDE